MKFFDEVMKHPKKFKKDFDNNITAKDLKEVDKVGKKGAEADKKSKIKFIM